MSHYRNIILSLCFLALAACSNSKKIVELNLHVIDDAKVPTTPTKPNTSSQLAQAGDSVSRSMYQMSAIELANNPQFKPKKLNPKAIHMTQITSIDWVGPLEQVLNKMAQLTHYSLRIVGQKPVSPTIIVLKEENKMIADILRNIQYQASQQARINIDPDNQVLELFYLDKA